MATMRVREEEEEEEEEEEQVWVTHYSSNHHILLVGEGDFSFSLSLATLFRSASNLCASSLDSYDDVVRKYKKARSNLEALKRLGALLLHGVDATKLHFHPLLRFRRFDRIIFNFPHAGFHSKESDPYLIRKHRELVFGFFHGASHMLRADGQVHVSHKNKEPFCHWNLEELASRCFLALMQCVAFDKSNYPGYHNKRGDGSRCDQPFLLGDCSTFKFRFCRVAKELYAEKMIWKQAKERESKCSKAFPYKQPVQMEFQGLSQRSVSLNLSYLRDHNLRQVQDHLVQSVHRTSPYQQQLEAAQFQDNSINLDKLGYTERRSSLLCRDSTFLTDLHHQEQFHKCSNWETRVSFPDHPYDGESAERRRLFCQDFPVQTREEPLFERFNRVSHRFYNVNARRVLAGTSFPHPYTGEAQEQSFTRQSNLNIHPPPQHWINLMEAR